MIQKKRCFNKIKHLYLPLRILENEESQTLQLFSFPPMSFPCQRHSLNLFTTKRQKHSLLSNNNNNLLITNTMTTTFSQRTNEKENHFCFPKCLKSMLDVNKKSYKTGHHMLLLRSIASFFVGKKKL